jgi:phosphorylcholine metabolism protein LicD
MESLRRWKARREDINVAPSYMHYCKHCVIINIELPNKIKRVQWRDQKFKKKKKKKKLHRRDKKYKKKKKKKKKQVKEAVKN